MENTSDGLGGASTGLRGLIERHGLAACPHCVARLAPSREERRMAEWLNAIRLEVEARGTNANMETVLHYAQEALSGHDPHWMTDEYINRARDPRLNRSE